MPVCAAVLIVDAAPDLRSRALETLKNKPDVLLGELVGDKLPIAVSTADDVSGDDAFWKELLSTPGVLHADILFAALDSAAGE